MCPVSTKNKSEKQSPARYIGPWPGPGLSTGHWLLGFALLLAVVSYYPTLRYGFVFDDVQQIVENPAIRSWNTSQYFTAHVGAGVFPWVKGSFYRPLFLIWLRLNYILFHVSPWGWHLTSLLAHLAAIWMLFVLVRQTTSDAIMAGWAALLFAVHPIHIEAVAWISAVPEILFALAGMGAIHAHLRYRCEQRWQWLGLSAFLYGLSLLAKETAIVIWPMIIVSGYWLESNNNSEEQPGQWTDAVKSQSPFAAISIAYFGLRFLALHGMAGEVTHTTREIVCAAPSIAWFYLQKLALPFRLSQIYFDPDACSFVSPHFYLPLLAVTLGAAGLFLLALKFKLTRFPTLLLGLPLIPPLIGVSVFPRHDLVHNRYLYLPSAGACVLIAFALGKAADVFTSSRKAAIVWATSIVGAISVLLILPVWAQEWPYHDNIALFRHSVELAPKSAMAWGLLGEEHMTLGEYGDGIAAFHRAQSLEPNTLLHNYRLGAAYYLVGNMSTAETYFQLALQNHHNPDVATFDYVLYRLGLCQYAQGKMVQAEASLRRAADIQPKGFGYHLALGAALKFEGNLGEAKRQFELELELGPDQQASALLRTVNDELGIANLR